MPFLSRVASKSFFNFSISSVYSYMYVHVYVHTSDDTHLDKSLLGEPLIDLRSVGDVFGTVGIVQS